MDGQVPVSRRSANEPANDRGLETAPLAAEYSDKTNCNALLNNGAAVVDCVDVQATISGAAFCQTGRVLNPGYHYGSMQCLKIKRQEPDQMEAKQIQKLYEAMAVNGFSSLELKLGTSDRLKLVIDSPAEEIPTSVLSDLACVHDGEDAPNTQVEIRSDKVGVFNFSERRLKKGDRIKKGETLGLVKGISFQDRIKCSLDGIINRVEIEEGTVVDYGRLLFVVDID